MAVLSDLVKVPKVIASVRATQNASDLDSLHDILNAHAEFLGFTSTSILPLLNPATSNLNIFDYGRSNWPEEFQRRWVEQRYVMNDPISRFALRNRSSFKWSDIRKKAGKRGRLILDESRDFGLNEGFAVPVMCEDYPTGIVSFGAERIDISPDDIAGLELVCIHAYAQLIRITHLEARVAKQPLTAREIEVLHYVAGGKSNIEIGIILGIKPDTVKKHLDQIRRKQDSVNRAHAVAVGLQTGELLP